MKPGLNPYDPASPSVSAVSATLAAWYDAHSVVRRLWAIQDARGLRVVVTLEPTLDSNDTHPVWIANGPAWAHELRSQTDPSMRLEHTDESLFDALNLELEDVMLVALSWRDPSII